ncbi:Holliday junction branch migration protein RuvA [Candidatus Saccharibacteria bacterium]|nr:Holliday junction branch migration protein RuvA [Candidatus Saccharibacteria bacterium]MBQ3476365.1 Holliday junction branch migration protein RuvA [Candidatus Saccharibacteria bacterium]
MIAHLKGTVEEKFGNSLILDVHGVGYEIMVSGLDFEACNLKEEKKFYTYHAVRENAEELYGFSTLMAKKVFELLIGVQGIGPKAAMAILSLAEPEEVRNAIANADTAFVCKASGVGKKSAERVIVDLRDKVGIPSRYGATEIKTTTINAEPDEALDALIALGFPLKEATAALEKVDNKLPVEERIRLALKKY